MVNTTAHITKKYHHTMNSMVAEALWSEILDEYNFNIWNVTDIAIYITRYSTD